MQLDEKISHESSHEPGLAKIIYPDEILDLINLEIELKNKEIKLRKIDDPDNKEELEEKLTDCGIKAGIEVKYSNTQPVVEIYFENEKRAYPRMTEGSGQGTYLAIKTDSSTRVISHRAFKYVIEPILQNWGYASDGRCTIETCLADVFANAVIFGSRAGEDLDYLQRNKNPPKDTERKINQNKPINLQMLITDRYVLAKITDTGPGITTQDYEKTKQYAEIPDNFLELSPEEQKKYFKTYGRGLFMIEKATGEPPLFVKEFAFSTSFIVYKDSEKGSCLLPSRDKNRPINYRT